MKRILLFGILLGCGTMGAQSGADRCMEMLPHGQIYSVESCRCSYGNRPSGPRCACFCGAKKGDGTPPDEGWLDCIAACRKQEGVE